MAGGGCVAFSGQCAEDGGREIGLTTSAIASCPGQQAVRRHGARRSSLKLIALHVDQDVPLTRSFHTRPPRAGQGMGQAHDGMDHGAGIFLGFRSRMKLRSIFSCCAGN
jgi:hypothetical protein